MTENAAGNEWLEYHRKGSRKSGQGAEEHKMLHQGVLAADQGAGR